MTRWAQAALLFAVGAAILKITASGRYLDYVQPGMRPLLLGAGVVFVGLALAAAADLVRRRGHAGGHAEAACHGHEDGRAPRVAWLLALPVLAILVIAPPSLGSYAAARAPAAVVEAPPQEDLLTLPATDPAEMSLTMYGVRANWDEIDILGGRTVALTGFVTPRAEGGWHLTRMVITCCAADAMTVKVEVQGAPAPPTDSWVRVTGRKAAPSHPGPEAPAAVEAISVEKVAAPTQPYE